MVLPISQDQLTAGPFVADTVDGVFYIKTNAPAYLTLYYGILPGGEMMARHNKVLFVDDSDEDERGVIPIGGVVPGTRLKIESTQPILQAEFLQQLK